jgi:hypothetical protein
MKRKVLFWISVICTISGFFVTGTGQERKLMDRRESMKLFTDRTMYIAGEVIQFSAFHLIEKDSGVRILYTEMITPEGNKIAGGKYLINHGLAAGCLQIPEGLLTGIYYIRAYTRTMRNTGPSAYSFIPVKVINPLRNDILANGSGISPAIVLDTASGILFTFSGAKERYKSRETVDIAVRGAKKEAANVNGMCITVVPAGSIDNSGFSGSLPEAEYPGNSEQYFIEKQGISLSGKLMDRDLKTPIPERVVTLSIMGDKDFSGYKTDRNGRFFFTLPDYTGSRDIFLSLIGYSASGAVLFIDNDFCSVPVKLPNPEFILSPAEKETALNMAANARITSIYQGDLFVQRDTVTANSKPFYDVSTTSLLMDKFIQLPTLQEYFDELPLDVKIRERKDGKYFKFFSSEAGMMVNDPLVLVDWVVITDINNILSLSPQKIARIEIVNKPYVKGNLTYGGIISILSREGDFAGIDLPGSGLFVKYDFLAPTCQCRNKGPVTPNIPDSRNTVLWNPDFQMKTDAGKNKIIFDTPDTPGRYIILIRGVFPDGRVFSQQVPFIVTGL